MNPTPAKYHDAVRLERLLGDPANPENLLSFRNAMARDDQEQFPEAALLRLHQLGVDQVYVPEPLGGRFGSCEGFIALIRTVSRRDLSVAVSHGTMVWTLLAWIAGDGFRRAVMSSS